MSSRIENPQGNKWDGGVYPLGEKWKIHPPAPERMFDGDRCLMFKKGGECHWCKGTSVLASNFLEVYEDNFEVAYCPTSLATLAKKNIDHIVAGNGPKADADKGGSDRTLRNICWECLGREKHNDPLKHLKNNKITGESQVSKYFEDERQ